MMFVYAIRNRKTKKLVTSTNFNYSPHRQIYKSGTRIPLLFTKFQKDLGCIEIEMRNRMMSKGNFEIVKLKLSFEEVIE